MQPQKVQTTCTCLPLPSHPADPQAHFLSPLLLRKIHSSSCNHRCGKDLFIILKKICILLLVPALSAVCPVLIPSIQISAMQGGAPHSSRSPRTGGGAGQWTKAPDDVLTDHISLAKSLCSPVNMSPLALTVVMLSW